MNTDSTKSFSSLLQENPCSNCATPCCRLQITPHDPPRTMKDIDHIRFSLLFPNTEFIVYNTGEWSINKRGNCVLLDQISCTCTVHKTPEQPLICSELSPYNCWYKRNFVNDTPPDIYRLNRERFEEWIEKLGFNEMGEITSVPTFEQLQQLLSSIFPLLSHS